MCLRARATSPGWWGAGHLVPTSPGGWGTGPYISGEVAGGGGGGGCLGSKSLCRCVGQSLKHYQKKVKLAIPSGLYRLNQLKHGAKFLHSLVTCLKGVDPASAYVSLIAMLKTISIYLATFKTQMKQTGEVIFYTKGARTTTEGRARPTLHKPHCLKWFFCLILCKGCFADAGATGAIWVRRVLGIPGYSSYSGYQGY